VALALSVWQTILARRQTANLTTIGERLSTRYLGGAPDYFTKVKDVIGRAKGESLSLPAMNVH
jgi:hypothetical protein